MAEKQPNQGNAQNYMLEPTPLIIRNAKLLHQLLSYMDQQTQYLIPKVVDTHLQVTVVTTQKAHINIQYSDNVIIIDQPHLLTNYCEETLADMLLKLDTGSVAGYSFQRSKVKFEADISQEQFVNMFDQLYLKASAQLYLNTKENQVLLNLSNTLDLNYVLVKPENKTPFIINRVFTDLHPQYAQILFQLEQTRNKLTLEISFDQFLHSLQSEAKAINQFSHGLIQKNELPNLHHPKLLKLLQFCPILIQKHGQDLMFTFKITPGQDWFEELVLKWMLNNKQINDILQYRDAQQSLDRLLNEFESEYERVQLKLGLQHLRVNYPEIDNYLTQIDQKPLEKRKYEPNSKEGSTFNIKMDMLLSNSLLYNNGCGKLIVEMTRKTRELFENQETLFYPELMLNTFENKLKIISRTLLSQKQKEHIYNQFKKKIGTEQYNQIHQTIQTEHEYRLKHNTIKTFAESGLQLENLEVLQVERMPLGWDFNLFIQLQHEFIQLIVKAIESYYQGLIVNTVGRIKLSAFKYTNYYNYAQLQYEAQLIELVDQSFQQIINVLNWYNKNHQTLDYCELSQKIKTVQKIFNLKCSEQSIDNFISNQKRQIDNILGNKYLIQQNQLNGNPIFVIQYVINNDCLDIKLSNNSVLIECKPSFEEITQKLYNAIDEIENFPTNLQDLSTFFFVKKQSELLSRPDYFNNYSYIYSKKQTIVQNIDLILDELENSSKLYQDITSIVFDKQDNQFIIDSAKYVNQYQDLPQFSQLRLLNLNKKPLLTEQSTNFANKKEKLEKILDALNNIAQVSYNKNSFDQILYNLISMYHKYQQILQFVEHRLHEKTVNFAIFVVDVQVIQDTYRQKCISMLNYIVSLVIGRLITLVEYSNMLYYTQLYLFDLKVDTTFEWNLVQNFVSNTSNFTFQTQNDILSHIKHIDQLFFEKQQIFDSENKTYKQNFDYLIQVDTKNEDVRHIHQLYPFIFVYQQNATDEYQKQRLLQLRMVETQYNMSLIRQQLLEELSKERYTLTVQSQELRLQMDVFCQNIPKIQYLQESSIILNDALTKKQEIQKQITDFLSKRSKFNEAERNMYLDTTPLDEFQNSQEKFEWAINFWLNLKTHITDYPYWTESPVKELEKLYKEKDQFMEQVNSRIKLQKQQIQILKKEREQLIIEKANQDQLKIIQNCHNVYQLIIDDLLWLQINIQLFIAIINPHLKRRHYDIYQQNGLKIVRGDQDEKQSPSSFISFINIGIFIERCYEDDYQHKQLNERATNILEVSKTANLEHQLEEDFEIVEQFWKQEYVIFEQQQLPQVQRQIIQSKKDTYLLLQYQQSKYASPILHRIQKLTDRLKDIELLLTTVDEAIQIFKEIQSIFMQNTLQLDSIFNDINIFAEQFFAEIQKLTRSGHLINVVSIGGSMQTKEKKIANELRNGAQNYQQIPINILSIPFFTLSLNYLKYVKDQISQNIHLLKDQDKFTRYLTTQQYFDYVQIIIGSKNNPLSLLHLLQIFLPIDEIVIQNGICTELQLHHTTYQPNIILANNYNFINQLIQYINMQQQYQFNQEKLLDENCTDLELLWCFSVKIQQIMNQTQNNLFQSQIEELRNFVESVKQIKFNKMQSYHVACYYVQLCQQIYSHKYQQNFQQQFIELVNDMVLIRERDNQQLQLFTINQLCQTINRSGNTNYYIGSMVATLFRQINSYIISQSSFPPYIMDEYCKITHVEPYNLNQSQINYIENIIYGAQQGKLVILQLNNTNVDDRLIKLVKAIKDAKTSKQQIVFKFETQQYVLHDQYRMIILSPVIIQRKWIHLLKIDNTIIQQLNIQMISDHILKTRFEISQQQSIQQLLLQYQKINGIQFNNLLQNINKIYEQLQTLYQEQKKRIIPYEFMMFAITIMTQNQKIFSEVFNNLQTDIHLTSKQYFQIIQQSVRCCHCFNNNKILKYLMNNKQYMGIVVNQTNWESIVNSIQLNQSQFQDNTIILYDQDLSVQQNIILDSMLTKITYNTLIVVYHQEYFQDVTNFPKFNNFTIDEENLMNSNSQRFNNLQDFVSIVCEYVSQQTNIRTCVLMNNYKILQKTLINKMAVNQLNIADQIIAIDIIVYFSVHNAIGIFIPQQQQQKFDVFIQQLLSYYDDPNAEQFVEINKVVKVVRPITYRLQPRFGTNIKNQCYNNSGFDYYISDKTQLVEWLQIFKTPYNRSQHLTWTKSNAKLIFMSNIMKEQNQNMAIFTDNLLIPEIILDNLSNSQLFMCTQKDTKIALQQQLLYVDEQLLSGSPINSITKLVLQAQQKDIQQLQEIMLFNEIFTHKVNKLMNLHLLLVVEEKELLQYLLNSESLFVFVPNYQFESSEIIALSEKCIIPLNSRISKIALQVYDKICLPKLDIIIRNVFKNMNRSFDLIMNSEEAQKFSFQSQLFMFELEQELSQNNYSEIQLNSALNELQSIKREYNISTQFTLFAYNQKNPTKNEIAELTYYQQNAITEISYLPRFEQCYKQVQNRLRYELVSDAIMFEKVKNELKNDVKISHEFTQQVINVSRSLVQGNLVLSGQVGTSKRTLLQCISKYLNIELIFYEHEGQFTEIARKALNNDVIVVLNCMNSSVIPEVLDSIISKQFTQLVSSDFTQQNLNQIKEAHFQKFSTALQRIQPMTDIPLNIVEIQKMLNHLLEVNIHFCILSTDFIKELQFRCPSIQLGLPSTETIQLLINIKNTPIEQFIQEIKEIHEIGIYLLKTTSKYNQSLNYMKIIANFIQQIQIQLEKIQKFWQFENLTIWKDYNNKIQSCIEMYDATIIDSHQKLENSDNEISDWIDKLKLAQRNLDAASHKRAECVVKLNELQKQIDTHELIINPNVEMYQVKLQDQIVKLTENKSMLLGKKVKQQFNKIFFPLCLEDQSESQPIDQIIKLLQSFNKYNYNLTQQQQFIDTDSENVVDLLKDTVQIIKNIFQQCILYKQQFASIVDLQTQYKNMKKEDQFIDKNLSAASTKLQVIREEIQKMKHGKEANLRRADQSVQMKQKVIELQKQFNNIDTQFNFIEQEQQQQYGIKKQIGDSIIRAFIVTYMGQTDFDVFQNQISKLQIKLESLNIPYSTENQSQLHKNETITLIDLFDQQHKKYYDWQMQGLPQDEFLFIQANIIYWQIKSKQIPLIIDQNNLTLDFLISFNQCDRSLCVIDANDKNFEEKFKNSNKSANLVIIMVDKINQKLLNILQKQERELVLYARSQLKEDIIMDQVKVINIVAPLSMSYAEKVLLSILPQEESLTRKKLEQERVKQLEKYNEVMQTIQQHQNTFLQPKVPLEIDTSQLLFMIDSIKRSVTALQLQKTQMLNFNQQWQQLNYTVLQQVQELEKQLQIIRQFMDIPAQVYYDILEYIQKCKLPIAESIGRYIDQKYNQYFMQYQLCCIQIKHPEIDYQNILSTEYQSEFGRLLQYNITKEPQKFITQLQSEYCKITGYKTNFEFLDEGKRFALELLEENIEYLETLDGENKQIYFTILTALCICADYSEISKQLIHQQFLLLKQYPINQLIPTLVKDTIDISYLSDTIISQLLQTDLILNNVETIQNQYLNIRNRIVSSKINAKYFSLFNSIFNKRKQNNNVIMFDDTEEHVLNNILNELLTSSSKLDRFIVQVYKYYSTTNLNIANQILIDYKQLTFNLDYYNVYLKELFTILQDNKYIMLNSQQGQYKFTNIYLIDQEQGPISEYYDGHRIQQVQLYANLVNQIDQNNEIVMITSTTRKQIDIEIEYNGVVGIKMRDK
ncbi:Dynein_heavy chain [Hexamita inflata]|uniref:Putative n=1 Tax=Hexamita inflata TaxID=28002 RepID=A0AA86P1L7_9EUKA|nr:Dynein heavy chain [Hexamita inflata]